MSALQMMNGHGEAVRGATASGAVVLSKLQNGFSQIKAFAPSLRFVLDGEERYTVDGRSWSVGRNQFILVEAGAETPVRTWSSDATLGLCIYLSADGDPPEDGLDLCSPVIRGSSSDPLSPSLRQYAEALLSDSDGSSETARRLLAHAAGSASAFLQRFDSKRSRLSQVRPAARTETLQRLECAHAFIEANAERQLTLDEIARVAALSRFHLIRTFAEVYGMPPLAFHRSVRLTGAEARLRAGLACPTAIAEELGYSSLSAFSRAFRTQFGAPPSRARSGA